MKRFALLAALLWPIGVGSAPFLSSAHYTVAAGNQPIEFLVSIDDGAEVISPAVFVRQVSTFTITAYDAATTYKITIGGFDVTQVGTGGTAAMTAQAFATALNDSVNANFTPITWSSSGAVITGKADVGGVAFTPTTSVTGGAGTIGAPVALNLSTSKAPQFDLEGVGFGSHTANVKAQTATTTSTAATFPFDIGVETPSLLLVIPGAP